MAEIIDLQGYKKMRDEISEMDEYTIGALLLCAKIQEMHLEQDFASIDVEDKNYEVMLIDDDFLIETNMSYDLVYCILIDFDNHGICNVYEHPSFYGWAVELTEEGRKLILKES